MEYVEGGKLEIISNIKTGKKASKEKPILPCGTIVFCRGTQGAEVEMEIEANAQALINMSRKRLCNQASPETREVMQEMKKEVSKRDEFLARVMVKECVYRGFCPEIKSCNHDKTEEFEKELKDYRDTIR